jgi:uncharacterized protein (TIGR02284 family)
MGIPQARRGRESAAPRQTRTPGVNVHRTLPHADAGNIPTNSYKWIRSIEAMKTISEKSQQIINNLIEICKDGQQGFQTAADDAKDETLMQLFRQYAAQRTAFIAELQERVRSIGGEPDKHGTVSGTLHRGWINLKAAVSSNEPHAVLVECERGEDAAVKTYREALAETELDPETRRVVQRQATEVQAAHDRVKQLRDSETFARR